MTSEQLEEMPISEDSLQSRIGEIGNCIHNLSCEHQDNDEIAYSLQEVRGKAWGLSIDIGVLERRVLAAEKLVDAAQEVDDFMRTDKAYEAIGNGHRLRAALTAYREASK